MFVSIDGSRIYHDLALGLVVGQATTYEWVRSLTSALWRGQPRLLVLNNGHIPFHQALLGQNNQHMRCTPLLIGITSFNSTGPSPRRTSPYMSDDFAIIGENKRGTPSSNTHVSKHVQKGQIIHVSKR